MAEREAFRITVNLRNFFRDHRCSCKIFISKKFKVIQDLLEHIGKIFNISEFYILSQNDYLPPTEDIRVLSKDDTIEVVPHIQSESNECKVVEDKVLDTSPVKKKKKKKKHSKDEVSNSTTKRMKMDTPACTSTPVEQNSKKNKDKDSLLDSNKLGFVQKVQYFESWSEKDSPESCPRNKSKITVLRNDLISECNGLKSEKPNLINKNSIDDSNIPMETDSSYKKQVEVITDNISANLAANNFTCNIEPSVNLATSYYNNSNLNKKPCLPETVIKQETNLIKPIVKNVNIKVNDENINNSNLPISNSNYSTLQVNDIIVKPVCNISMIDNLKTRSVHNENTSQSNLQINDTHLEVNNKVTDTPKICDTLINDLKKQVNLILKSKSLAEVVKDSIENTETESNYEGSMIYNFDSEEPSKSLIKRKRKRVRKRAVKKISLLESEVISPEIYKPYVPPNSSSKPKMHIIFNEVPIEIQDSIDETKNQTQMVTFDEVPIEIQDSVYEIENQKKTDKIGSFVSTCDNTAKLSPMDTILPKVGDEIMFRILKLINYSPTVSEFITAKVMNFNEGTGNIDLLIKAGREELEEPEGKFSMSYDDANKSSKSNIGYNYYYNTNWKEIKEPHLRHFSC